ncbi:MAG: GNAT family N-acetyltransferase [Pseudomonadota bacterium]
MSDIEYIAETPAAEEFIALRAAAGMSVNTRAAAEQGLPNSWFAVCVRANKNLVGMGRIIGDGGCVFQIVDIVVRPDYQRQGIGYGVMKRLMAYLYDNAPTSAYVSLIADGDAHRLYQKFGFEFVAPASVGMALRT